LLAEQRAVGIGVAGLLVVALVSLPVQELFDDRRVATAPAGLQAMLRTSHTMNPATTTPFEPADCSCMCPT
jgi:hypothetical protein